MNPTWNAIPRPWSIQTPPMHTIRTPTSVLTTFPAIWNRPPIGFLPRTGLPVQKLPRRLRDVRLAHQALADEKAPHARRGKPFAVGVALDPALADKERALGRERGEPFGS